MANLLTNGDFETNPGTSASVPIVTVTTGGNGLSGWTVSAGTVDIVNTAGWSAAGGSTSLDLNGTSPGTISQSFPTVSGKVYKLTFSLAGNPAGITSKSLKVNFGGASQAYNFDVSNTTAQNMQWVTKTQQFTATGTTATLEFQSQTTGAHGPAIDNVLVEEAGQTPKKSYAIQDQFAEKGQYQLKTLPKYGKLLKNGEAMKVDDRFTQKDINTGVIKYDVGVVNSPLATIKDDFNFVVLSGGAPVTQSTPKRSLCMPVPDIFIPSDGVYTFPITLLVTPPPTQKVNTGLSLYETQTKDIGKAQLEWGNERSTPEQIVYTTTAIPLPALGVLSKNGTPVAVGDKFTQAELTAGGFSFKAAENVQGTTKWQFGICNQVDKCAAGDFTITVKPFPSPVITKSNMSINECAKDVEVTVSQLMATLAGGSDFPNGTDEIVYTFDGCETTYDITPGKPGTPGTPATPDRLGASVLKLRISGSILGGVMPKWRVEVDGNKVGDAEYVTKSLRSKEEWDEVTLQGAFGSNPNQVVIFYLNNDTGNTPDDTATDYEHDRNLYVDYIELNGKKVYGKDVSLEAAGSWPNAPKYGGIYVNQSLPFITGGAPPATIPGTPAVPGVPEVPEIRTPKSSTLTVGRLTITPCSFTNKGRETTKVKISDNCTGQSSTDCINLPFTASWRNKSAPGKFRVCFIPKPVITEPMPSGLTSVDACLYKTVPGNQTETANGFFSGVAQLLANCGEFVVIYGRDVPKDIPVGTIVYLPDAGPKTVLVVPKEDGTTGLVAYPNTPTQPATGDFPIKDTAGSLPNKFESSDDGTKFIRDGKGQIVPVQGTAPGGGTQAPNIDGFAQNVPHVTDVDNPSQAPATQTKIMLPNGITLAKDTTRGTLAPAWFVEGDIDYGIFFWSGPNEFYVAPGQSFVINVFGPRGFVKITPQGSLDGEHFIQTSNGYTQYYAYQQGINWDSVQGFLGVKSGQEGNYAWGGEAVSSKFIVKQGNFPVIFSRAYTNLENYVQVGTNPGGAAYGGRPNYYPDPYFLGRNAYPPEIDKSNISQFAGVPYYVWWHINGARSRLNGATTGEAKAYRHAILTPAERVPYKANGPGPLIDLTLPGAGTTWEFPLTATDLVTGQQLSRTYKVHWSATGRSPAGRSAETTDTMGLIAQGAGAVPGSIHCKINYNPGGRAEDNCSKK